MRSIDLPSSFIEKNFQEVIVTQQPSKQPKSLLPTIDTEKVPEPLPKEKILERTLSKSSIDNNPIFMIYTKCESVENLNKVRKSLWRVPVADRMKTIWWIYTWPIKFILTITVPNPKTYRRAYPLTFFMCILWIGINAYMIVWMMTVVGNVTILLFDLYICNLIEFIFYSFICRLYIQNSRCCHGFDLFSGRWLHAGGYIKCNSDSKR